VVYLYQN